MSLIVDTNVLVYFFLKAEPFFEMSRSILEVESELIAPDIWRPEFLNAIWLSHRSNAIGDHEAFDYLPMAANIISRTVPSDSLWMDALQLAIKTGHPPNDTLFVALAQREETLLVTYDQRILTLFPGIAKRPDEILKE